MARVWREIEALGLNDAERKLVAACKAGEVCVLGDGTRPEGPDPDREVRAEVLRYLIQGGCEDCRVHEWGVQLVGAWVSGELDLSFAKAEGITFLVRCRFEQAIKALQTRFEFLNLSGSTLPGLMAQGVKVTGDVFLRGGFVAEGAVHLSGARIGGQLNCGGGQFRNAKGWALNAQRMRVNEGFFWRKVTVSMGAVDLASAHVGDLVDDLESWPEAGRLYLDGFTYDKIGGKFTDVAQRLEWLARGTIWEGDFHPQPYSHLAKVYRGMGHEGAAREVLIERNRLLAVHQRKRLRAAGGDPSVRDVVVWGRWLGDFALRRLVGYGYAPFRSLGALVILWLVASWLAFAAWQEGSMVPNSDVILTSAAWQGFEGDRWAGANWSALGAPGQDWETFSALAWGVDLVVPILDLGQRVAWAPSTARGAWGAGLWWGQWLLEAAGWIVAGLFAAAVTGIIRKEDD